MYRINLTAVSVLDGVFVRVEILRDTFVDMAPELIADTETVFVPSEAGSVDELTTMIGSIREWAEMTISR